MHISNSCMLFIPRVARVRTKLELSRKYAIIQRPSSCQRRKMHARPSFRSLNTHQSMRYCFSSMLLQLLLFAVNCFPILWQPENRIALLSLNVIDAGSSFKAGCSCDAFTFSYSALLPLNNCPTFVLEKNCLPGRPPLVAEGTTSKFYKLR